ncbi:MAG: hypothetical protein ACP5GR_04350 [Thermoplasmata archaeon]
MDLIDYSSDLRKIDFNSGLYIIVEGQDEFGISFYIKNLIKKRNGNNISIKLEENSDNLKKILETLNLSNQYLKIAKYSLSYSPLDIKKNKNEENIAYILIKSKLDDYLNNENNYLIIENIDLADLDLQSIIFQIITEHIKNKNKGGIILTYSSKNINENLIEILIILKSLGFKEIKFEKLSEDEVIEYLHNENYNIPTQIISYIYSETNGNLKKIMDVIKLMEKNELIVNKYYVGELTNYYLSIISKFIVENIEEKKILEELSPGEIVIILYLTFLNNKIDELKLLEITNLPEKTFIDSLDSLIRKGIINEIGDGVEIKHKKFSEYIQKVFSNFKFSDAHLKIAKIKEEEGNYFEAGFNYFKAGNYDKAYEILKKLGIQEFENNNFKKARECFDIAIKIKRDDPELIKYYSQTLMIYGDWEETIKIINENLKEIDLELKLILAEALYESGKYNESLNLYNKILTVSKDPDLMARALFGIGVNLYNKNSFIGAKYFIEMSKEKAKEIKNYKILAKSLRILGRLFSMDLNYEESLKYLNQSKEISESIGDMNELIETLIDLGQIYSEINVKEGIKYYFEAQKLAEKYWYPQYLIPLYINNSLIYLYNFQIKEMIFLLKRAYVLSIIRKDYQNSIKAVKNLFYQLIKSGEFNDIWNLLINGINYAEHLGKKYDIIELKSLSNILMLINGDNPEWENNLILLENSNLNYYINRSLIIKVWLTFYSRDFWNSINILELHLINHLEDLGIENIIDIIDFVPYYIYSLLATNSYEKNKIYKIIDNLKYIKYINDIDYINKNLKLLDLFIKIEDSEDEKIINDFYDLIKIYKENGLFYQTFIYKTIFGIAMKKYRNNNIILKDVLSDYKTISEKGIIKVFDLLNEYENNM